MKAPINKILDHTMVDGPGNRTAIFFQQCNIDCKYCHNPETKRLCCHCRQCVDICPANALKVMDEQVIWTESACVGCDSCIRVCSHDSSPKVVELSAAEVFEVVKSNVPFIRGITVSGGECSLYLSFLNELFGKCRSVGLTCLIDCNGTIPLWNDPVIELCDGVMLDVKAWSDEHFLALTGAHNQIVKENLYQLAKMDKLAELRVVCLEEWVDAAEVIEGMAGCLTGDQRARILLKLIRFRNHGVTGLLQQAVPPAAEYMNQLAGTAKRYGFQNIRIV